MGCTTVWSFLFTICKHRNRLSASCPAPKLRGFVCTAGASGVLRKLVPRFGAARREMSPRILVGALSQKGARREIVCGGSAENVTQFEARNFARAKSGVVGVRAGTRQDSGPSCGCLEGRSAGAVPAGIQIGNHPPPAVLFHVIQPVEDDLQLEEEMVLPVGFSRSAVLVRIPPTGGRGQLRGRRSRRRKPPAVGVLYDAWRTSRGCAAVAEVLGCSTAILPRM